MKRLYLITIFLSIAPCFGLVAQDKELTMNEKIGINNLKDHVTYKRKEAVAKHIIFPLKRCSYFDFYIKDQQDFINSFDIIFDDKQIESFRTSKWKYIFFPTYGYYSLQGGGYVGGFDDEGKLLLSTISLSESEKKYIQALIEKEKTTLHASIRNYKEPVCVILAGKYRIRIDRMPDNTLRYCSWNREKDISAQPDLVIYGGREWGNSWGDNYRFKNGEYEYYLEDYIVSDNGPIFTVRKNGIDILTIDSDVTVTYYRIP